MPLIELKLMKFGLIDEAGMISASNTATSAKVDL